MLKLGLARALALVTLPIGDLALAAAVDGDAALGARRGGAGGAASKAGGDSGDGYRKALNELNSTVANTYM